MNIRPQKARPALHKVFRTRKLRRYTETMMIRILLLCFLLFIVPAQAQTAPSRQPAGEVTSVPVCGKIKNRSDQTIMGTMATKSQMIASGDVVAHQENFKLAAGEEREFCAAGPFFEGRRLELTLRTLIPLFSCYTKIDREIFLDAKPDGTGFKKLSATCY